LHNEGILEEHAEPYATYPHKAFLSNLIFFLLKFFLSFFVKREAGNLAWQQGDLSTALVNYTRYTILVDMNTSIKVVVSIPLYEPRLPVSGLSYWRPTTPSIWGWPLPIGTVHCTQNPISVFPEMKLRGLPIPMIMYM
jgi:hypothetical protein